VKIERNSYTLRTLFEPFIGRLVMVSSLLSVADNLNQVVSWKHLLQCLNLQVCLHHVIYYTIDVVIYESYFTACHYASSVTSC